jgi:HK97 family phage portal protein
VIVRRLVNAVFPKIPETMTLPELLEYKGFGTSSGQTVTAETSKNLATAYRCINILSDDVAKMPLQTFISHQQGVIERIKPDAYRSNIAWLLEVRPNRYMTPFVFKKTLIQWLLTWGAAYVWHPWRRFGERQELFILPTNQVVPVLDEDGSLWYRVTFGDGSRRTLPDVEVFSLIINSVDGITGRSVITHARESLGRQMGAYETQGKFYSQGLNPGGILWINGVVDKDARAKIRSEFERTMSGSENAYRLAIMDEKESKFEPITMKPVDVQFLEGIQQNDLEIANFFGMPLFKLNMGKQAYNSNEQANLDYLNTTLDPYLVQFEQAAMLKWLSEEEQNYTYLRFNRDVLLRTDAKTRAEVHQIRINSGMETPNEGRQIEDLAAYEGGDRHYFPANMAMIEADGSLRGVNSNGEQS